MTIEVVRQRSSVTQGEAEVRVNGETLVQYGDKITMDGTHGAIIAGWGSEKSDRSLIVSALSQYPERFEELAKGGGLK